MAQGRLYSPIPLTLKEVQRLRLLLSIYQDGSGMLEGGKLPGWRDFERATAAAFGGSAAENKGIFDVVVPHPALSGRQYGISCKMRRELTTLRRTGRVTIELTNAAGAFWTQLEAHGINHGNYLDYPAEAGRVAINIVEGWVDAVGLERGGTVDLSRSFYLILSWAKSNRVSPPLYQLHQFPSVLPEPSTVSWSYRPPRKEGTPSTLVGTDYTGSKIFEWYGSSGGQFKYFPLEQDAVWRSDEFQLEPLPELETSLVNKAAAYFPELWSECAF